MTSDQADRKFVFAVVILFINYVTLCVILAYCGTGLAAIG